jgi:hypothetical protein
MNAKSEIIDALKHGADPARVLEILRAHSAELSGPKAAYQLLEEIWRELGPDVSDEESELRNELDFAMERTWYTSVATVPAASNGSRNAGPEGLALTGLGLTRR